VVIDAGLSRLCQRERGCVHSIFSIERREASRGKRRFLAKEAKANKEHAVTSWQKKQRTSWSCKGIN